MDFFFKIHTAFSLEKDLIYIKTLGFATNADDPSIVYFIYG